MAIRARPSEREKMKNNHDVDEIRRDEDDNDEEGGGTTTDEDRG